MRNHARVLEATVLLLVAILSLPLIAAKKATYGIASFAKYVQIPGATSVGSDACTTCHADIAKDFRHAFHTQQGIECEQCHGPGSLHVEGGGDVAKIFSFSRRSAADGNGVCLSCHLRDAKIRNWLTGAHSSNQIRCTDCHQTHSYSAKAESKPGFRGEGFVDVMSPGRATAVESLVPEAKVIMQPRWQANDACLSCHERERAFSAFRPGGVRIYAGAPVLEHGMVEEDFKELASAGVTMLGEVGLGSVEDGATARQMVAWARKYGLQSTL